MRKIIQLGESLRLYLTYSDIDTGLAVDPVTLSCTVRNPNATITTITYPSTNFVRELAGRYYIRIVPTLSGTHTYRVLADIGLYDKDVRDGKFDVEPNL